MLALQDHSLSSQVRVGRKEKFVCMRAHTHTGILMHISVGKTSVLRKEVRK